MKKTLTLLLASAAISAGAQTITTIAGNGAAGFTGDGVPATASGVYNPYDVGMDSVGNIFIGDAGNNRIRKVTPAGVISTVAGNGVAGYNGDGIMATDARLNFPYGMSVSAAGVIVITDMDNNRIRSIQSESGGLITTICGTGVAGYSGDGGPATDAQINKPQGIFWDREYNVYFSDAWNNRVRKIDAGGTITTVGGNGTATSGGDGGPATAAGIYHPSGLSVDTAGNIYVAEMRGHRIRKISTTGIITTVAGSGTLGFSGDGGPATLAKIRYPKGVSIDKFGNVIFADTDNQLVRKVDVHTGIITSIAGTAGAATYGGDGGPATLAKLNFHQGVFTDTAGNIYIGDCLNNRVRKIECVPVTVAPIAGMDTVCIGATISLTNTTTGGTWHTSNANASVSGGTVTGLAVGLDTVYYTVTSSCNAAQASHAVYVKDCSLGIGGLNNSIATHIHPNPATNEITISDTHSLGEISVLDIAGKVVYHGIHRTKQTSIDIAQLSPGTYFVKYGNTETATFVKQ